MEDPCRGGQNKQLILSEDFVYFLKVLSFISLLVVRCSMYLCACVCFSVLSHALLQGVCAQTLQVEYLVTTVKYLFTMPAHH